MWAEAAIREALAILVEHGKASIASDLGRILATVNFSHLGVTRHSGSDRIIHASNEAGSTADLLRCLHETAVLVGATHATVHVVQEGTSSHFAKRVATTYPEVWIDRYVSKKYFKYDAVVHALDTECNGFYWGDIVVSDPLSRQVLREAEDNKVGPSGYSYPVTTKYDDLIALSIASVDSHRVFKNKFNVFIDDIPVLAHNLVEAFVNLNATIRTKPVMLNDAQVALLRTLESGVSIVDMRRMQFDGWTFDFLSREICAMMNATTLEQSAIIAAKMGLLEGAIISRPDILSNPLRESICEDDRD